MMTAEQWVKHQESYNKYGFEMKPKVGRQKRKKAEMSAKDRSRILMLIIIGGLIVLSMVVASAYGAAIKYENNKITEGNNALKGEVESLQIQIQSANNIASIETKALEQGMVYPEGSQLVVVASQEKPENGFSALLKAQAYDE